MQVIFQLTIIAPLFWGSHLVRSSAHLRRIVWLIFVCNWLSVIAGVLQVYYPARFMPVEFTSVDTSIVERLSFVGAGGVRMLRPPGLTDTPGGASVSGMLTAVLGIVLAISPGRRTLVRGLCFAASAMGLFVLFITQVRSLLVTAVFMVLVVCGVLWQQKLRKQVIAILAAGALLLTIAFARAVMVGGDTVRDRFVGMQEKGVADSYRENRGHFVLTTFKFLLPEIPFGAGLGRWGMMQIYFNKNTRDSPTGPLYAEIQLTGWLLDGGVPLWFLYGGAILSALLYSYRSAVRTTDPDLAANAAIILGFSAACALQSFASPTFNTQWGLQVWFLNAALFGAMRALTASTSAASPQIPEWKAKLLRRFPNQPPNPPPPPPPPPN